MQLLQSGVLIDQDKTSGHLHYGELLSHAMPSPWVKAMIATRINQCIRGHSAMTQDIIEAALDLARRRIVPIVPLRHVR
jgi:phenylalanine ammonia-lyase